MRSFLCIVTVAMLAVVPAAGDAQQPTPAPCSGGLTGRQAIALAIVAAGAAAIGWDAVAGTAVVAAGTAAAPAAGLADLGVGAGGMALEPVVLPAAARAAALPAAEAV